MRDGAGVEGGGSGERQDRTDVISALLAGCVDLPESVRRVAESVADLGLAAPSGTLGTGAGLASSVIALARLRHALDAALAEHLKAAVTRRHW